MVHGYAYPPIVAAVDVSRGTGWAANNPLDGRARRAHGRSGGVDRSHPLHQLGQRGGAARPDRRARDHRALQGADGARRLSRLAPGIRVGHARKAGTGDVPRRVRRPRELRGGARRARRRDRRDLRRAGAGRRRHRARNARVPERPPRGGAPRRGAVRARRGDHVPARDRRHPGRARRRSRPHHVRQDHRRRLPGGRRRRQARLDGRVRARAHARAPFRHLQRQPGDDGGGPGVGARAHRGAHHAHARVWRSGSSAACSRRARAVA